MPIDGSYIPKFHKS